MMGVCPYCHKMNEEQNDGYFWCSCRDVGGRGVYYLPLEVVQKRKDMNVIKNSEIKQDKQTFLDMEEQYA